jgi:hypothetical protein
MDIERFKQLVHDPNSQEGFDNIQAEAEALLEFSNLTERLEFVEYLSEILGQQGKVIQQKSPQYYDKYQYFWLMLVFNSFVGLSEEDQENMLKQRVLSAVKVGFDQDEILTQYYDAYATEKFITEQFKHLSQKLADNSETIGAAPIEIDGKKFLPQLKYWILDYSKFPTKVAKRGSLERLNYINVSPNTRQLTQVQRQQLLQILELYDQLLNPQGFPTRSVQPRKVRTEQPRVEIKPEVPVVPVPPKPLVTPKVEVPKVDIDQKLEELRKKVSQQ